MSQLHSNYHKIFSKIKLLEGLEKEILKRFENQYNTNRVKAIVCLLYTSPSPRDRQKSRMPSSA